MKINEIFGKNIIQGEGPFAGQPATFIRTFGCIPPYCRFCDTKYSWTNPNKESHEMSIEDIIKQVKQYQNKLVVITGGEPFLQKEVYGLCNKLNDENYIVQFETSGKASIDRQKIHDNTKTTIVMSPKQYGGEFKLANAVDVKKADYYKFVIENREEMQIVDRFIMEYNISRDLVYLMAKGATRAEQIKNSQYVMEQCYNKQYKYSPRLHVLLNDDKRGV